MNRHADPVEVEVAYVPTEEQEIDAGANPLLKLHHLLKGRYVWVVLAVLVFAVTAGVVSWQRETLVYTSQGKLEIKPYIPRLLYGDTELTGTLPLFNNYFNAQAELIQSEAVISRAMNMEVWLEAGGERGEQAGLEFARSLNVAPDSKSNMVTIGFTDEDPQKAKAAVEATIKAYSNYHEESQSDSGARRVKLLMYRRDELTSQLQRLKDEVREIGSAYGSDSLEPLYNAKFKQLTRLEAQMEETRVAVEAAQSLVERQDGELSVQRIASVDQQTNDLLGRINDAELRLSQVQRRYGENHPTAAQLRQEISMLQSTLDHRVSRIRQSHREGDASLLSGGNLDQLRIELARMQEQHRRLKQELAKLGEKNLRMKELQAQASQTAEDLATTRDRLERINVESTVSGRLNIISLGNVPRSPSNVDRRFRKTVVGAFGGGIFGFILVAGVALLNRRYRYSMDASSSFGNISLLGILPTLPENLDDPDQAATAAHCVHNIRTLLQVSPGAGERRAFCVTSPASGTGKTSLALAMGISFASSGNRTLLVDFDLFGGNLTKRINTIIRRKIGRILVQQHKLTEEQIDQALERAQQHGQRLGEAVVDMGLLDATQIDQALKFQEQTEVGLLDALGGEPVEQCVGGTGIHQLHLLPTGGATPKHAGQLSPGVVRRVLDQAREHFDVIVVDTGPIPGSIEASLITTAVDAVVFTVSRGEQRSLAEKAIRHLESLGATVAGVVFNRAGEDDFASTSYSLRSRVDTGRTGEPPLSKVLGGREATETSNRYGPIAGAVASYLPASKNGQNGSDGEGT